MGSDNKRKRRENSRSLSPDDNERKRANSANFKATKMKINPKNSEKYRRARHRSESSFSSTDSDRSPDRKKLSNKPKPKKKVHRSPSPERSKRKRRRSKSQSRSSSSSRSRTPEQKKKANPSGDSDKEDRIKKKKKRGRSSSRSRSRSRSRSPDKRKDKDRSKDRGKERERYDRDRERYKERDRDKREKTSSKENGKDSRDGGLKSTKESKSDSKTKSEKASKQEKNKPAVDLDDIEGKVKKRKERIEQWRAARRKDTEDTNEEDPKQVGKKWSLEDDDEPDEEEEQQSDQQIDEKVKEEEKEKEAEEEKEDDEELDPLDAYMKDVQKEVKKLHSFGQASTGKGKTTTIVKTVVKKSDIIKQIKPEVIEQNQDLMEYSSEEEKEDNLEGAFDKLKKKKKKELLAADHNKIYYAPFRKSFYVAVPELARMTPDEVTAIQEESDIQARGKGVPKPLKSWAQSGVNMKYLEVLKKCNYEKPTPIQAQAIPTVMSGRDVIGIAKTGSGKTLAFLLPMFRHILDQPPLDSDDGPIAIIMTPTRELALQIWKECRKFCKPVGLQAACIYGGSGISEQVAELKRGAEIIVCTPGRMIDMLTVNNGRVTNCRRCTYLVLDEADRMFDMGFEPQVTKIIDNIRPDRQTVMFSATFPRQMEALARKLLTKPIEIQVGGRSVVCSDVTQHAIVIEEDNKFLKLLELLGVYQERGGVLVFTEKQDDADKLFKDLLKRGYPCLSLHGGMDQFDRDSTIADFKNGVTTLMVATSVAARGLDVKNLILVVNFDCPNHYEDYVHRCGRTGRAGNKGTAFTFVTAEQGKYSGDIVKAMEKSGVSPPDDLLGLWELYKEELKNEGKELKKNSGFSGKGFKFNDEELVKSNEMRKMQKWSLGMQDSDDEAEAAENAMDKIEEDLEKAFGSKPKKAPPQVAPTAQAVGVTVAKDKLDMASIIAAKINIKISQGHTRDRTQQATSKVMQGGSLEQITGIGLAKQLADKVNAKLNYKAPEPEKEEQTEPEEKLQKYEEEIEVNDFPQQARWRITSKETISQVGEISEAGITVRGSYIPPGKQPAEGEKKLHLYIESLSERSIQTAKAEVRRLLKEELIKYESSTYRPQQPGRYKVV